MSQQAETLWICPWCGAKQADSVEQETVACRACFWTFDWPTILGQKPEKLAMLGLIYEAIASDKSALLQELRAREAQGTGYRDSAIREAKYLLSQSVTPEQWEMLGSILEFNASSRAPNAWWADLTYNGKSHTIAPYSDRIVTIKPSGALLEEEGTSISLLPAGMLFTGIIAYLVHQENKSVPR